MVDTLGQRQTDLTDRFDRAFAYVSLVHGGQRRRGTSAPYIAHLMAVSATVLEYGADEDVAVAALLHDTAEDQGGEPRLADIRSRFGDRVARIVEACSDSLVNTGGGRPKLAWEDRKGSFLARLRVADEDFFRVCLADKVHNTRSILRDLRTADIGLRIWDRFSVPKEKSLWYYRSAVDAFREARRRLSGGELGRIDQLVDEFAELVSALEAE